MTAIHTLTIEGHGVYLDTDHGCGLLLPPPCHDDIPDPHTFVPLQEHGMQAAMRLLEREGWEVLTDDDLTWISDGGTRDGRVAYSLFGPTLLSAELEDIASSYAELREAAGIVNWPTDGTA